MAKRKVILITDGDCMAAKTVEITAQKVGGCAISLSMGNPTVLSGGQIVKLIKEATRDPVLVMVDDKGRPGKGQGESVLEYLVKHQDIEVLGIVAVAANSYTYQGVKVDFSIDRDGNIVHGPVDKGGCPEPQGHKFLEGDTVEVINELDVPVVVGTGDTGKMDGNDAWYQGAEITTRAVKEILARSENNAARQRKEY